MRKVHETGSVGILVALSIFIILFVSATGFGLWAYASRQDYKDNADKKAAQAVVSAIKDEDAKKDAEFAEKEKNPYRTYTGPVTYGKLTIQYPKTWSAVVNETNNSSTVIDGYLHPNFVPGLQSDTNFALRIQIVSTAYDQLLKQFDSAVKSGAARVTPYRAPKVTSITGARIDGQLDSKKKGSMVLLPIRDKTIKLWTESDQFGSDFNNIILANLTFVP